MAIGKFERNGVLVQVCKDGRAFCFCHTEDGADSLTDRKTLFSRFRMSLNHLVQYRRIQFFHGGHFFWIPLIKTLDQ